MGPIGEVQGMSERSDEIPPHKTIGPNSGPDSATFDSIESQIYFILIKVTDL